MALGLHSRAFHADDNGGTRGEVQRKAELESARRDYEPAGEAQETSRGALGTVSARGAVKRAEAALHRQQRVARGQPLYKGSRFVGNLPPD